MLVKKIKVVFIKFKYFDSKRIRYRRININNEEVKDCYSICDRFKRSDCLVGCRCGFLSSTNNFIYIPQDA
jgi:hypothetical protein